MSTKRESEYDEETDRDVFEIPPDVVTRAREDTLRGVMQTSSWETRQLQLPKSRSICLDTETA